MSLLSLIDDTLKCLSDLPEREKQRNLMQRTVKALASSIASHEHDDETKQSIRILEDCINGFDERLGIFQAIYGEWQTIVRPYLSKLRFLMGWFGQTTCRILLFDEFGCISNAALSTAIFAVTRNGAPGRRGSQTR